MTKCCQPGWSAFSLVRPVAGSKDSSDGVFLLDGDLVGMASRRDYSEQRGKNHTVTSFNQVAWDDSQLFTHPTLVKNPALFARVDQFSCIGIVNRFFTYD